MSRVDDLVARLCPDGVEWKTLGEACSKARNFCWDKGINESKKYIDLASVDKMTHRIMDLETITAANAPSRARQVVYEGDLLFATTRPTQMRCCLIPKSLDGQICSTGYCVLRANEGISNHYLLHVLTTERFKFFLANNQTEGNYPAISEKKLREYRIPVPPMEVQEEIVRVLDAFTDLETELETELEARRKQYAYYRDKLLDFGDGGGVLDDPR